MTLIVSSATFHCPDLESFPPLPGLNFPAGSAPLGAIGANSASDFAGKGGTESANTFIGSITTTVSEVLPNGHLVIAGERAVAFNASGQQLGTWVRLPLTVHNLLGEKAVFLLSRNSPIR